MREEEGNGATHPRGREGRSPHMQRRNQGPPPPKFLLKQRNAKGPLESAKPAAEDGAGGRCGRTLSEPRR